MYAVYVLFDPDTWLVYYVGQSQDYLRRFREHVREYNLVSELREQGIDLLPYPVMFCETREQALEYELRWIFHCYQTRQPLVNATVSNALWKWAQESSINFLGLPPNAKVKNVLVTVTLYKKAKMPVAYKYWGDIPPIVCPLPWTVHFNHADQAARPAPF
jgi:predicted GIY-YIG superfamily endonuclease